MLRQLESSIWVDEVPFKLLGIDFGNRMTCIQLADRSFWLHSPNRFDPGTQEKIAAMGKIQYLVAPSLMHNLFVMDWKDQAGTAQVLAPSKAKKVRADIELDRTPPEDINHLFGGEIICLPINGMPMLQEYAFVHQASKTLILTDLAFNFGEEMTAWSGFFLKLYGAYNKFGPTLTIRALIRDKNAFGESLNKILSHEFERIIISHGQVVEQNAKEVLQQAFNKYLAVQPVSLS